MNKPLEDWTLREVKAYCESRETCEGCVLSVDYCKFDDMGIPASDWPDHTGIYCDPDTMIPGKR